MNDITNEIASKHLGKKSLGSATYDRTLLVKIPRILNREQYNLKNDNLPFLGFDIWQCYEFSSMTKNNLPITRLLKIKYDCKNEFIVESKSLKLYLNSFNLSSYGNNVEECLNTCKRIIETDLTTLLETKVEVNFLNSEVKRTEIFEKYKNIVNLIDEKELKIEQFKENPELLKTENKLKKKYFLKFDSLRSNCRVTHQPDFADIFIYYKSKKHILESSLIKYLVSFRNEFHFHEECCEMIFKRLCDVLNTNDELMVCALYTRRGGIDITPIRLSKNLKIDSFKDLKNLVDLKKYSRNGIKQ